MSSSIQSSSLLNETIAASTAALAVSPSNKKGLSAKQLNLVFPYHIAVDSSFLITQVGTKLEKLFPKNEVTKESSMIGQPMGDYFTISSPPRFTWDWKRINMSRDSTFDLDLKAIEDVVVNKPIKKLPLSGGIVISDPVGDPACSEVGIIFLVNLRVRHTMELENYGFTLSDVSHFAFQKELILAGEHLRTEVNMSHKLEQITKNLEEEKIKTLRVLETKRSFVRYVSHEIRTPLNIVMMGLKYFEEMIERWQHRRSNSLLASVTPSAVMSISHRDSRGPSQPVSHRSSTGGSSRSSTSGADGNNNSIQSMSTLPFSPSMKYIRDNTNYNSQHNFAVDNSSSSRKCSPATTPPHIYTDDVSSSKYILSRSNSPSRQNRLQPSSFQQSGGGNMVITNESAMSALTSLTMDELNLNSSTTETTEDSNTSVINAATNTATVNVNVSKYTANSNTNSSSNNMDVSHGDRHHHHHHRSSINHENDSDDEDDDDDLYDLKEMESAITDMTSASSIAVDILNDLLLYEKIEGNLLTIEFDEVYVQDLVLNVVQLFQLQASSKDISVSVDLSALAGVYVDADISKFSQVLRNIMSNALKFTPLHGGIVVTAEVFVPDESYYNSSSSEKSIGNNSSKNILSSVSQLGIKGGDMTLKSNGSNIDAPASTSPPLPLLNLSSMKLNSNNSGHSHESINSFSYSLTTPHSSTGSSNNNKINVKASSTSSSSSVEEDISPLSPLRHFNNNNNSNNSNNLLNTVKSRKTNDQPSSSTSLSFSPSAKAVVLNAMGVTTTASSSSSSGTATRIVRRSLGSYSGPVAVSDSAAVITDTSSGGSSNSWGPSNNDVNSILTRMNINNSAVDADATTSSLVDSQPMSLLPSPPISPQNATTSHSISIFSSYPPAVPIPVVSSPSFTPLPHSPTVSPLRKTRSGSIGYICSNLMMQQSSSSPTGMTVTAAPSSSSHQSLVSSTGSSGSSYLLNNLSIGNKMDHNISKTVSNHSNAVAIPIPSSDSNSIVNCYSTNNNYNNNNLTCPGEMSSQSSSKSFVFDLQHNSSRSDNNMYSHSPSARGGFNYPPTPLHNSFSNSNGNNVYGLNLSNSSHSNSVSYVIGDINAALTTPSAGSKGSGGSQSSNNTGTAGLVSSSPLISLSSSKSTATGEAASTPHSLSQHQPLTSSWWRVSTLNDSAGKSRRGTGQQSLKSENRVARISIRDTGHGISLEDQRHLFQEFIQVRANKLQDGGGSGLGLWVARKIMEAHAGSIHVRSAGEGDQVTNPVDRGSTFYIDIPVSRLDLLLEEHEVMVDINDVDDGSASSRSGYASSDNSSADGGSGKGKGSNIAQRIRSSNSHRANKRSTMNNDSKSSSSVYSVRSDISNNSTTTTITTATGQPPLSARLCPPELNHELFLMEEQHADIAPALMPARFSSCVTRSIQCILIVDDSGTNRKMMSRLLRDKAARIDEACDGRDAISKYLAYMENDALNPEHTPYDVIMMDFVMPVMNGPDCVRELRRIGCKGLIIGVTGNSTQTDINAFLEAGVNRVMIKPLEVSKFMSFALAWVQRLV